MSFDPFEELGQAGAPCAIHGMSREKPNLASVLAPHWL
ncbi:Hypothetical protein CAP_4513 [Chondromyces apiculatus DSM 436]|uniref:Uncharacterized protein n=1 Tax=Chondromyces apiculatus DSM 436 TaxID=1192034 RepID=A0A017T561_9BACT|nr:Hypothetical protein CAP_4513 [Chondromyces apiculatus DSM 436]